MRFLSLAALALICATPAAAQDPAAVAPSLVVSVGAPSAPFTVATSPVTTTKKPKITARANGVAKTKTLTVTP